MDAAEIQQRIWDAFPGVPHTELPRALSAAESKVETALWQMKRRADLIAEIQSYPVAEQKRALAAAKRKGWGLDGMSTDKLELVHLYLTETGDEC